MPNKRSLMNKTKNELTLNDKERIEKYRLAAAMKIEGATHTSIAQTLGVDKVVISRWFRGQVPDFCEIYIQVAAVQLGNRFPKAFKALDKSLDLLERVIENRGDKAYDADNVRDVIKAAEVSSNRAAGLFDTIAKISIKRDGGSTINVQSGANLSISQTQNNVVVATVKEAEDAVDKIKKRLEFLKSQSIEVEKVEPTGK